MRQEIYKQLTLKKINNMKLGTKKLARHEQRIGQRMRTANTRDTETRGIATPKWLPIPPPQENCPVTGISGAALAELTSPPPETADQPPPVRSKLVKQEGAGGEVRVFDIDSFYEHLNRLAEEVCRSQRRMRKVTTKPR